MTFLPYLVYSRTVVYFTPSHLQSTQIISVYRVLCSNVDSNSLRRRLVDFETPNTH